jgi:hypothetical protein
MSQLFDTLHKCKCCRLVEDSADRVHACEKDGNESSPLLLIDIEEVLLPLPESVAEYEVG